MCPSDFYLPSPDRFDVEGVLYPFPNNRASAAIHSIRPVTGALSSITRSASKVGSPQRKDCSSFITNGGSRSNKAPRPSALPQSPSVHDIDIPIDETAEYALVISMYEVYNDRIFDLLTGTATKSKNANVKRRALLFKSTEQSPDRKVVAGLAKIICGSLEEALMVLETGLMERKVTGTGSNAVSSRSHGFFCVEVKKRDMQRKGPWSSSTLTIVDLAGSERARNAKTAGETLAEAGKINESLMYLGQCMQMQSDHQAGSRVRAPFFCPAALKPMLMKDVECRPVPPMQTHRTTLLEFVPLDDLPHNEPPPAPEIYHGCHRRRLRGLQRHFPDPEVLCNRP